MELSYLALQLLYGLMGVLLVTAGHTGSKRELSCEDSFHPVGGTCLIFLNELLLEHTNAQMICEDMGGRLAVIDTAQKLRDIAEYIENSYNDLQVTYWIDGFRGSDSHWSFPSKNSSLFPVGTPFWGTSSNGTDFSQRPLYGSGDCLTMPYDKFYYFTEEDCELGVHSLLCEQVDDTHMDYEGTFGIISSPNYPSSYPAFGDWSWSITTPEDTNITINFEFFYTQHDTDYLEIRDGSDSNSPVLAHLTGNITSIDAINSTSNNLFLQLYSTGLIQRSGFKLNWAAVTDTMPDIPCCCGCDCTGLQGSIESPNYPDYYPTNTSCVWTVTTRDTEVIAVRFSYFSTYTDHAYLEIRDVNDIDAPLISNITGDPYERTLDVLSTSNTLFFHFQSDTNSSTDYGFSLMWYAVEPCGGEYRGTEGLITSPVYPSRCPKITNCQWAIVSPEGTTINIIFDDFYISSNDDDYYGYFQIRDGGDSNAPVLFNVTYGNWDEEVFMSSSNSIFLEFHVNDSSSFYGNKFKLSWVADYPYACPHPYIKLYLDCYAFEFEPQTFNEAKVTCFSMSGQLARITGAEQLRRLYGYIHYLGIESDSFWTGASDRNDEGHFVYDDGTPVPKGTPFWGTGGADSEIQEPDGNEEENCVALVAEGYHFLRDVPCSTRMRFICSSTLPYTFN